jgi:hypothetical protein
MWDAGKWSCVPRAGVVWWLRLGGAAGGRQSMDSRARLCHRECSLGQRSRRGARTRGGRVTELRCSSHHAFATYDAGICAGCRNTRWAVLLCRYWIFALGDATVYYHRHLPCCLFMPTRTRGRAFLWCKHAPTRSCLFFTLFPTPPALQVRRLRRCRCRCSLGSWGLRPKPRLPCHLQRPSCPSRTTAQPLSPAPAPRPWRPAPRPAPCPAR